MFRTQYDRVERVYTNHGDPEVTTFTGRYDENGDLKLVMTGTENLYDKIQAEAASCDMDIILRRFANGDISVLSQSQGIYADVADAPMHFTDALNMVRSVEEEFDRLPASEREKFDNDWVKFGASLVNPVSPPVATELEVVAPDVVVKEEVTQ